MTSPDLKKLITGFLLLAAVTSSSAFFLSNTINTDRAAPAPQAADTQPIASAPRSPFVEQLQETNAAAAPASVPEPPANLTDALADEFAKELLRVNPDGPQDTDGGLAIVAPDIEVVIKTFTQNQRVSGTSEAWDREVESLNIDVREQFSPRDVQIYAAAANAILTKRLVETGLADALVAHTREFVLRVSQRASYYNELTVIFDGYLFGDRDGLHSLYGYLEVLTDFCYIAHAPKGLAADHTNGVFYFCVVCLRGGDVSKEPA